MLHILHGQQTQTSGVKSMKNANAMSSYLLSGACLASSLSLLAYTLLPFQAHAQQAESVHLQLDTGGHLAFIKDVVFTPDGDLLLSASDDKTIRVWDWRSGVTLRTIRGQIGDGNEGKIFAIDVSPDGHTVAAGGWFGAGIGEAPPYGDIRLFNISTGRIEAILKGLDFPVYDLDFSPDGNFLAAGGQEGFVHVWQRDETQPDGWRAHGTLDADAWRIEKLAFSQNGEQLVVATTDNGLRIFDMTSGETVDAPETEFLRDNRLSALAMSPDGINFATGSANGSVHLWHAKDGSLIATLPQSEHLIGTLSFSADGQKLLASCGYHCDSNNSISVWLLTQADTAQLLYDGHDNSVVASTYGPDNMVVTAGGESKEIHLWDVETGQTKHILRGSGAPIASVSITPDGSFIAWGTQNPCPDLTVCPDVFGELSGQLQLPTPDLGFENPRPFAGDLTAFNRATIKADGWSLRYAQGGQDDLPSAVLEILHNDQVQHRIINDATNGYLHSAYTLLSDGSSLVTGGSDGTLLIYDRQTGALKGELRGHTDAVLAMAEASEVNLLITGSADQTLRLWDLTTQKLISSMFFAEGEWIAWTPQGYFNSSPNGDDIVGWHVNQGPDKEARYLKARQLRQHLNSPEIVRRAIIEHDPSKAAQELRGTDRQLEELLQRKPPEFEIKIIETDPPAPEGFVTVEIMGADEAGTDVASFAIMANERRIDQFASRTISVSDGGRMIIEVPVQEGENNILISGINQFGYITERGATALAPKRSAKKPKGKLYVIAIGINEYPHLPDQCSGKSCNLRFPVADATEFLRVVSERTLPLYAEMEALLLVNREALESDTDRANAISSIVRDDRIIEPEARTIRDEIIDFLDLPGPDDTTIIFIAGHGINVGDDYYVIPTNGRMQDNERWQRSSLVPWSEIHEAIERAKGRRFMLIDTCHAANAFNPKLEKQAADSRIVVLAATAANNTAAELSHLGHGAFTWSVLEGMRGKAGASNEGVRILGLSDFVDREVRRLTNDRQAPFYHLPRTENFLVAAP